MRAHIKQFFSAFVLIAFLSMGLEAAVKFKTETVVIQTSAVCESCKNRIEKALKTVEGIVSANLNLDTKKIKVKYDPAKTTPDQIRAVISNTGYDADEVKKNEEAFKKLPKCCQNGGAGCTHE
ncbi:MAG TPA: heavy metal-associated domain-containing protein [Chitinophagales bacterium]|nr:heavy metal-associated domain-containing protein [Chitinophagales bacterium]